MQLPGWRLLKWLGKDAALGNIERAMRKAAVQTVRADIIAARINAAKKGIEHHTFLHSCHSHLEKGKVSPQNLQDLLSEYTEGKCPIACHNVLRELSRNKPKG